MNHATKEGPGRRSHRSWLLGGLIVFTLVAAWYVAPLWRIWRAPGFSSLRHSQVSRVIRSPLWITGGDVTVMGTYLSRSTTRPATSCQGSEKQHCLRDWTRAAELPSPLRSASSDMTANDLTVYSKTVTAPDTVCLGDYVASESPTSEGGPHPYRWQILCASDSMRTFAFRSVSLSM